ncbi:MAG: hypothetical protein ACJ788_00140 [Ktedonobacteraceae bacterium]
MAPLERNLDTATLLKLLDDMGRPFGAKLDRIEEKLANGATKDDLVKLRDEMAEQFNRVDTKMTNGYVSKDVYESRHSQLVSRDMQLDEAIRAERQDRDKDMAEVKSMFREVNAQLEVSRRQGELRFQTIETNVDTKIKESTNAQLNSKDRAWMRGNQIIALIALVVAIISPFAVVLLAHLQFH